MSLKATLQPFFGVNYHSSPSLVPQKSRAPGLLHLTRDNGFLHDLKISAGKLGRHLDEFGVWKWIRRATDVTVTETPPLEVDLPSSTTALAVDPSTPTFSGGSGYWSLVKTETEEDIFAELGHSFVEPALRNFDCLVAGKPKAKKTMIFSSHSR